MKVRFTPSGREQFLQVIGYILQDNHAAGSAFRRRAERVLRRLGKFPESGRLVPEFPELPFREVIVSPYRFFYRVKGRTVWVVAVWHSAQLAGEPGESNDLWPEQRKRCREAGELVAVSPAHRAVGPSCETRFLSEFVASGEGVMLLEASS